MRSRGIQAGDVVQVVRDCCGRYVGLVYTVQVIEFIGERGLHCTVCRWKQGNVLVAYARQPKVMQLQVAPVAWLRKFDPPAESIEEINRLWEPERETLKVLR